MVMTSQEIQLVESLEFSRAVAELIKNETGGLLEQVVRNDLEHGDAPGRGLSVRASNKVVETFVETQQSALLALGYRAFWSMRRLQNGLDAGDELVVLPTTDMLEIIRLRETDGANYGIFTEDIITHIEHWRTLCGLRVVGAAHDWVAMRFDTLPENICIFAQDVYQLCPDTVDQGVGLMVEEDSDALTEARALCPDVTLKFMTQDDRIAKMIEGFPDKMQEQFRAQMSATMEKPEVKAMMNILSQDPGPSQEDGIKLLAYEIQRTKYLFLWWD